MSLLNRYASGALAVLFVPGAAVAQVDARVDQRARISDEIVKVEGALAKLKGLSERKAMSGRGWTALDDLVVGAATLTASGAVYGLLHVLPRAFPRTRFFGERYLRIPKSGSIVTAAIGAITLAQGAVVYPFVPKAELNTGAALPTVELDAEAIDVSSLNQTQAEALLARLEEARRELDQSTSALSDRLAPKLASRLAFISSNVVSGGLAVIAIGGGMYFVASQAGRIAPFLMRAESTRAIGQMLYENPEAVHAFGIESGFGVMVQGVLTTLTGVLIRVFVPKNAKEAAPVT